MNIKLLRQLSTFMKYAMFASTVLMTFHCGFLLCGVTLNFAEWICGLSVLGFCMLIVASVILSLGNLFRAMVIYVFAVKQCILYQRIFQFDPDVLMPARLIAFLAGAAIIVWFMLTINKYREEDLLKDFPDEVESDDIRHSRL